MPRPLNLLLVEDNEDDAALISRCLSRAGFDPKVRRIQSEPELKKALAEQPWDVILSDYTLPEITCARALAILAESKLDIPFICISGTVSEDAILSIVRAGARDYVMKDNLARLPSAVEREIAEAEARRQHRRVEAHLQQAMKMEAIGRLAGGVAHDFNNLLTVITGFAQLALLEDNPARAGLEQILLAADRAAGLTRQLLAFSRQQTLQTKVFDLNTLIGGMEKMLGRLIGEDVRVTTRFDPETLSVEADPGQIEQVILNLAVNSRDAMPQGGRLTISTSRRDLHGTAAELAGLAAGSYCVVSVSDTGSGITSDALPHIFEPFYTTKGEGKGTGLGLSTSYGIARQTGGALTAYSEPGSGTTMTLFLPASAASPESAPLPMDNVRMTGSETVLITEDDPNVLRLIAESLASCGFLVLATQNATRGLDMLRDPQTPAVAVLVTDIVMPGLPGPLYWEKAQQIRPGLKVLFMSGYTEDVIQHHGFAEGTADFIQKPFSPGDLVRKIRRLLDGDRKTRGAGSSPFL
jgi:signal transduction histidine kinase